jgi:transposase
VHQDMEWWTKLRVRAAQEGLSKREVCREEGISWKTLEKVLSHPEPPGYRRAAPYPKPKLGPYVERIVQILEADKELPRKQRHTAQRISERLVEEGYAGSYTQVREKVAQLRRIRGEVFIPLRHDPGTAQVDVGEALVSQGGQLRKVHFFVMVLPYSDAIYVQAFWHARTEMFWEFHRRAFEYLEGVPRRISYDNDKVLVSAITGTRSRRLTEGFLQLQSHYRFAEHFCGANRPNEKGVVEATVKFARLKFFVPVPQVEDLDELNARLVEQCRRDLSRTLRGQQASKQVLLGEDQAAFLPLPATPFDACRKVQTSASSLSLVRFDTNDYSVPVCYAHHHVLAKGYVDRVEVCCGARVVARHLRRWGRGEVCLEPVHYLALLERKPGALDYGKPFSDWELPECFGILRARLERERAGAGTREFIQVLRLLERYSLSEVGRAIECGLRCNALIRDAIAQFLIPQEDWRQTTFRLEGREHLREVCVAQTDVRAYSELVAGGGLR